MVTLLLVASALLQLMLPYRQRPVSTAKEREIEARNTSEKRDLLVLCIFSAAFDAQNESNPVAVCQGW